MNEKSIYAGFIKRIGAFIVDTIIYILINTIIVSIVIAIIRAIFNDFNVNSFYNIGFLSMTSFFIVFILYFAFSESSNMQGSLGKRLTKIVVVDQKGCKLNFSKAFIRAVAKFFSLLFLFGYIFMFFNKKRQALHDFISNTTVINANK